MASLAHSLSRLENKLDRLPGFLRRELRPHHGRTAVAGRMVLACVITMILVLAFKLPYGFLAIFYAQAISRENPHATVRNGFRIIAANLAGTAWVIGGAMLLIRLSADSILICGDEFLPGVLRHADIA